MLSTDIVFLTRCFSYLQRSVLNVCNDPYWVFATICKLYYCKRIIQIVAIGIYEHLLFTCVFQWVKQWRAADCHFGSLC